MNGEGPGDGGDPSPTTDTIPLTEEDRVDVALARPRPLLLVAFHREEMVMRPLRRDAAVVVGRESPADVVIDDASLSRTHAQFTWLDDRVVVEDLGSTNGIWLGGRRVPRGELRAGDEVLLGGVMVSVHASSPGDTELLGVDDHERFRTRLEEEVVRARFFGRKLAVAMVSTAPSAGVHVGRWYARVRALLRPIDRMAIYSVDTAEILLPELRKEEALTLARSIAALQIEGAGRLLVGVVFFPDTARSAEEMTEQALSAVRRATAERPIDGGSARPWGVAKEMPRVRDGEPPIVASAVMRELYEDASRLARSAIPVLVHGETGVGKEVIARAIHEGGPRRDRALVYVNCAAIPEHLVEGTLFGHERGAFTSADQRQKGLFEAADGGTVMLDEIGDLPPPAQAVLLRVLETKRVRRIGATDETPVDVRIIAATHRDLEAMVAQGAFRSDLLYRLNTMTLTVPPLRERAEEIELLADRFLRRAIQENETRVRRIAPEALALLQRHLWPGNVRELRNVIERAVVIARTEAITEQDLPRPMRSAEPAPAPASTSIASPSVPPPVPEGDFRVRIQHHERQILVNALRDANDNQTEAARRLGMPLRTFAYKIKALKIKRSGYSTE